MKYNIEIEAEQFTIANLSNFINFLEKHRFVAKIDFLNDKVKISITLKSEAFYYEVEETDWLVILPPDKYNKIRKFSVFTNETFTQLTH